MMHSKHAQLRRTVGPFRAINAICLAVHGGEYTQYWWRSLPWRYRASDLPARIIDHTIRYQVGWYYSEHPEYQAQRLAMLTGLEVLRREVAARHPLTWWSISEAVSAAKRVMHCYEDGRDELRWIEEQREEQKRCQMEFAKTHPNYDLIAHLDYVDSLYNAWADQVMRRHIGYETKRPA